MAEPTFEPDSQIVEIAAAYSMDAVDLAARNFKVTLDWSEGSIRHVEQILGQLHDEISSARPPEDSVWACAKAFGSYIGEVLCRHHAGEWGMISMDGNSFPGLRQANGSLAWPWSKAHKRLTNGAEDNVWHYYSILIDSEGQATAVLDPPGYSPTPKNSSRKKAWWRFW